MANTRTDYWDVDGLSLHTPAVHLTVTPARKAPGRKGTNPSPIGLDGDRHADKPWGPVTWLLEGWVSDRTDAGVLAATAPLRIAQREANLDALEAALRGTGGQVTITKRRHTTGGGIEAFTRLIEMWNFDAVYSVDLPRDVMATAAWTAEVHSADPWWYTSPGGVKDHLS